MGNDGLWVRLHVDVLNNPKVMTLSAEEFRFWILCMAVVKQHGNGGAFPTLDRLAFSLRSVPDRCSELIEKLVIAGLIDRTKGGPNGVTLRLHDWEDWQYNAKTSTERVKRFRERSWNVTETVPRARAGFESRVESEESLVAHAREPITPQNQPEQKSKTVLTPIPDDEAALDGIQAKIDEEQFSRVWQFYLEFGDDRSRRDRSEAIWRTFKSMKDREIVVRGLIAWRMSKKGGMKYMETWLDERGWRDYPVPKELETLARNWVTKLLDEPENQAETR